MRGVLTSLGEVAGIVLAAVGAGIVHIAAGLIVGGAGLFAVCFQLGGD